MGAGAFWALSLQELAARSGHRGPVVVNGVSPYGPIGPKKDESTGLELLKLPDGFRYWSYSWTGDKLSDGVAWLIARGRTGWPVVHVGPQTTESQPRHVLAYWNALGCPLGSHRRSAGGRRVMLCSRCRQRRRTIQPPRGCVVGRSDAAIFLSTNGGSVGEGQVFEYDPRRRNGHQSSTTRRTPTTVDNPDNITVTPRGGLLLCEDAAGNTFTEGERLDRSDPPRQGVHLCDEQRQCWRPDYNGRQSHARRLPAESSGPAPATAPMASWLFVNIQSPGITFAITGPWAEARSRKTLPSNHCCHPPPSDR